MTHQLPDDNFSGDWNGDAYGDHPVGWKGWFALALVVEQIIILAYVLHHHLN